MAKLGEYGDKIATMTAQEVFDVGVEHLLTQMKKSVNTDDKCVYDGGDVCCAAAPFIKDYTPDMENKIWVWLVDGYDVSDNHSKLIDRLQQIHDNYNVQSWYAALEELSREFVLIFNPPSNS